MQELVRVMPESKKTFSRDIALLKKAGVQVRYSVKDKAFILSDEKHGELDFSAGKSEARYLEKLIRLITVMDDVPAADCDVWYIKTIPGATKRTMQRDFATLNSIGFRIKYERETWNMHDAGMDVLPNHYYCDRPNGAFSLTTFEIHTIYRL